MVLRGALELVATQVRLRRVQRRAGQPRRRRVGGAQLQRGAGAHVAEHDPPVAADQDVGGLQNGEMIQVRFWFVC